MNEENFNQENKDQENEITPYAPEALEEIKENPQQAPEQTEMSCVPTNSELPTAPQYVYHWDAATDGAKSTKATTKKKGYLTFAITMCVAFLIALSALVIVLLYAPSSSDLPSYTALYEQCAPYTVSIETSSGSIGSGFFITESGRLLTNQHVVGSNSTVTVKTYDGSIYIGKVVGVNRAEDIAVVDVVLDDTTAATTFTAAKLANSDTVKTGDPIISLGCPAKTYLGWTMTVGYVSNATRALTSTAGSRTFIQFDAPVNPGNSGGPLINANGEVIGIIQSKASETKYVYDANGNVIGYVEDTHEGLGFAIPMNFAKSVVNSIIEKYEEDPNAPKPQLGITGFQVLKDTEYFLQNDIRYQVYSNESDQKYVINKSNQIIILTDEILAQGELVVAAEDGIWVSGVSETAGAYGKLQKNDIIIQIDDTPINRSQLYYDPTADFMTIVSDVLNSKKVGDTVAVKVIRNGETVTVNITLTKKAE